MKRRETDFWERQRHAPLFEALESHARRKPYPFHVPGHKMGSSFDHAGKARFQPILSIDLTEISGMDDLHQPEEIIAEAQALAAEAFGAEQTKFLIGGSTVGNIALIMAVCKPGEKILVQRNCHKSVFNGIILARAQPIFVVPALDLDTGVAAGVRREDVERVLQEHPDVKAVFLTNPTYYGMGIDLAKMAATVHRFGIPLLVDEAHGAHYGFHPALPASAMECGADASVQSTHKMATSMTMTSMLHLQGNRVDRDRLFRALAMIQSSSPSYPLMASLDLARRQFVWQAKEELDRVISLLERLREQLTSLAWLDVPALTEHSVFTTLDPLKLMLCLRTREVNGLLLRSMLESREIFPELSEIGHILLVASTGTREEDVEILWEFLKTQHYAQDSESEYLFQAGMLSSSFLREPVIPMHEALDMAKRSVPLEQAKGEIAAEMVIPYPPGIPLVVPGERIDEETVHMLVSLHSNQIKFQGMKDPSCRTIEIIG